MARRSVADELEYPLLEHQELGLGREKKRGKPARGPEPSSRRRRLIWWSVPFLALALALTAVLAFHQLEAFLINDARFRLAAPAEHGQDPPTLRFTGASRISKAVLLKIFEKDLGQSVYLLPIEERRRRLLGLEWVKDAVVARRWPNRVLVELTEREPVAFAQIQRANGELDIRLIDSGGVLLTARQGENYDFIVLSGMNVRHQEADRAERVRQALALLKEIGPISAYLSEIDVEDTEDLMAMLKIDTAAVGVRLGRGNFRSRLQNFLNHFPEIRRRTPDARLFDLRIDGRITAIEGDQGGDQ